MAERSGDLGEVAVDAGAAKFAAVKVSGVIVADGADIVGAQSPPLAGDESGGDLAAGHDLCAEHFYFGAEGGELGKLEDSVGGVFADAENIETLSAHKVVVQGIGRAEKCKER